MPRIGYLAKTQKDFFKRLEHMMDLSKESLDIKRKVLDDFTEKGLYPYSRFYLDGIKQLRGSYWSNHFSTVGLVGMNEAVLNFLGKDIASAQGKKFSLEILDFMRAKMIKYQEETENLYNLEATPAEGTSHRLAKMDKERYLDTVVSGNGAGIYYTNSTQLPVGHTDDLFKALKHQDPFQTRYTGGTVVHGFLGERINDSRMVKNLLKKIFTEFHLPYLTFTPTFSICPNHGYLAGEHFVCPKCSIDQSCEVYSRIVGYITPVQQWHEGKRVEFKERVTYIVPETKTKLPTKTKTKKK
jgi:ribonucleoside-triphosphate reductase